MHKQKVNLKMVLLSISAIFSLVGALIFSYLYFDLYWRHRGLFNEQGRYFDQNTLVVYHEQNSILFLPEITLLLLSLVFGIFYKKLSLKSVQPKL